MFRSSSPEPAHSPTGGKAGRWRAYLLRVLVFALVFAILNAVAVLCHAARPGAGLDVAGRCAQYRLL